MLHTAIQHAYRILEDGMPINKELARKLADLPGEDTLDLISLANKVKNKFSNGIHACSIVNAKSGICQENCRFCAQSAHHHANIETYDLLRPEQILQEAETAYQNGVRHFGIVTSGTGYHIINEEFMRILTAISSLSESPAEGYFSGVSWVSVLDTNFTRGDLMPMVLY